MHEVAAIQGALRMAVESMRQAGASRVTNVQLAMAVSGHFTEDVVRQYFALLTADTPAAGATLTITWLPATYQCLTCFYTFQSLQPAVEVLCPECAEAALEAENQGMCVLHAIEVAFDETSRTRMPAHLSTTIFPGEEAPQWQA